MTLYNEIDPYAAQWLRNLAAAGHISAGTVDERSITDVRPDDLVGVHRAHFFAGIGVWDYALRLAGWPDDRPVWTGSCPCQPFSVAGKRGGVDDDRHLWPEFFRLIRECRPDVVFGEQVSSADGRTWLDAVSADLESAGYAVGAIVANSASVGAPHGRHRIYFVGKLVADPQRGAAERHGLDVGGAAGDAGAGQFAGLLGNSDPGGPSWSSKGRVCEGLGITGTQPSGARADVAGLLGNASIPRREGIGREGAATERTVPLDPWRRLEWLPCRDNKARPTQPGLSPLAPRTSGRVDRLRPGFDGSTSYPAKGPLKGFGNAVTAQVAATFIRAFMESE